MSIRTKAGVCLLFVLILSIAIHSQSPARPTPKPAIKVTQVNEVLFKKLLVPNGKPLLINFWATWCEPCREEFPELVQLDKEYKGKIDFITVSLDDVEDIATAVPKFLSSMKAEMPACLLKTNDESGVITSISKDWRGGMPFTALYSPDGKLAYFREGKIVLATMRSELDKLLGSDAAEPTFVTIDYVKVKDGKRDEAMYFYENNWKPYRVEALKRGVIHSYEILESIPDSNAPFDLVLITRYRNRDQHLASEKTFETILKELRPNGPRMLNTLKPDDFRQSVFVYRGKVLMSSQ